VPPPLSAAELVFGYGNPGRGDDALGPMCVERLRGDAAGAPELLTDFQLQPEHALDLRGRSRVLFVDASSTCAEPCEVLRLAPAPEASVFTHALAPGALLAVFERIEGCAPPPSWMLAIRGYTFELGEPLSARAVANLEAAIGCARAWLATSRP
jgi:hydrogenase maturation protease